MEIEKLISGIKREQTDGKTIKDVLNEHKVDSEKFLEDLGLNPTSNMVKVVNDITSRKDSHLSLNPYCIYDAKSHDFVSLNIDKTMLTSEKPIIDDGLRTDTYHFYKECVNGIYYFDVTFTSIDNPKRVKIPPYMLPDVNLTVNFESDVLYSYTVRIVNGLRIDLFYEILKMLYDANFGGVYALFTENDFPNMVLDDNFSEEYVHKKEFS